MELHQQVVLGLLTCALSGYVFYLLGKVPFIRWILYPPPLPRRPSAPSGGDRLESTAVRYFYDTEFIEDGTVIDLVSIGVVAEDGREFYAIHRVRRTRPATGYAATSCRCCRRGRTRRGCRGRRSAVDSSTSWFPTTGRGLAAGAKRPELWAWVGAYDHVALAQLWGDMTELLPSCRGSPGSSSNCVGVRRSADPAGDDRVGP